MSTSPFSQKASRSVWLGVVVLLIAVALLAEYSRRRLSAESESKMTAKKARLVFVCVENSNRSQMAQAFARMHGGDRIEAYSAGSQPSGRVNPKAIDAMRELGYDLTSHKSRGLDELPDVEFDAAVTMGCGDTCPYLKARRRMDWALPDPRNLPPDEFRAVRDEIERRVVALLAEIAPPESL